MTTLADTYFGRRVNPGGSGHSGKITDINMWNRPLTKQEMIDWTTCKDPNLKGNLINWMKDPLWDIVNMTKIEIDESIICKGAAIGPILVPENKNAWNSRHLCRQLDGDTYLVKDEKSRQRALQHKYELGERCSKYCT